MQLIVLSGGSGKLLWPLSNNARSKQFLPLLSNEEGKRESMIQRVVRQIRSAQLTDNITFATNAVQRDSIINQLGDNIEIVTEPERRDTFPATALAATYLKDRKHCDDNEVVVIMPCDVYTEVGYFDTINKMIKAVESNEADLVLMGVKPTYASEEFGYVVPKQNDPSTANIKQVVRFTEKPNKEQAERLLQQGAFWNGGVFAFRLGYLLNITRTYVNTASYDELYKQYKSLPQISFDYEVAEKAQSVAVIPFEGLWQDLGSWNTLCAELPCTHIGNVTMGHHIHS